MCAEKSLHGGIKMRCEKCGSAEINEVEKEVYTLNAYGSFRVNTFKCNDCGCTFVVETRKTIVD